MRITSSLRPNASVAVSSDARDLIQDFGVRVVGAGRGLADDAARANEADERIDMAVGMVVEEALVEPDDFPRAEGLAQRRFRFAFRPAIAIVIEQGLSRGEDRALAVMLDGASFQHEVELADRYAGKPRDVVADSGVVREDRTCRPSHWS